MKCQHCGAEIEETVSFCPNCGEKVEPTKSVGTLFEGGLFTALCVLVSIAAGAGILSGSLPVLTILMTIFLWMIFAKSRSGQLDVDQMRAVSGTIFAEYVINWVVFGCLLLCAITLFVGGSFISANIADGFLSRVFDSSGFWLDSITTFSLQIVAIILLLVAGVILALNFFGVEKIHNFAQSLYQHAQNPAVPIVDAKAARIWMLVFGILTAIGSFKSGKSMAFVSEASLAAAYIVGYALLKKKNLQ